MFSSVLRSASAALDALLGALDWPLQAQSVVFVFGPHGEPLVCAHIEGTDDLDGFISSLMILLHPIAGAQAVVVGSVAAFATAFEPSTQLEFLDGRDRLDAIGIELIDWFLVDPTVVHESVRAVSLAEITDARPCWPGARRE